MKAHYQCSVCETYFDANKNATTEGALVIPTPTHSYGDWVKDDDGHWKTCSCGLKASEGDHRYVNDGDMICDDCGYDRTVPHTHGDGVKQEGQAATCTENGWKDYYKCSCGRIYADASCHDEITSFEEWKNGEGKIGASHNLGNLIPEESATCSAVGKAAHYQCSVCGTQFDESRAVKTENELTLPMDPTAHRFGDWQSGGNDAHTRVCALNGEHRETALCSGGTATCTERAVCDTCHGAYGETTPHGYGSAWETDEEGHFHLCECGDTADRTAHLDDDGDGNCDTCGYVMPAKPAEGGLPAGAVVGIVCGSVVVAGVGGFAIFWFVIKKKPFADLVDAIRKLFHKLIKK